MKIRNRAFARDRRRETGVAIVIILAFLVLLTGVAVAFFSRAIAERQVSNSSASQAKADTLARGALDVITGDLKQEIAVGSTAKTINGQTVYVPLSNTYVVPTRRYPSPTPAPPADPIPNLIRQSGPGQPGTPNAAIIVNGTAVGIDGGTNAVLSTTASSNGRKITKARWNSHYLIPRQIISGSTTSNTSSNLDSTPVSTFIEPSWVTVTNQGPVVLAAPSTAVIGRYAYAIYDEGGMLDANVAGYPSTMTATQVGEKGLLAFANLTQLPAYNPSSVPTAPPFFPKTQVDNLVGWRNYATVQPLSGSSLASGYAFDVNAGTRYLSYLLTSPGGFLSVNPQPSPSPAVASMEHPERCPPVFSVRRWGSPNPPHPQNLQRTGV